MPFVLDCSMAMFWCFSDERSDYSDRVLESLQTDEAIVPSIWILEILNVLLVAERTKRLREADSSRFLQLISELPISEIASSSRSESSTILTLARQNNLSSYDASYLDLAIREGVPMATQDRRLIKACRKSGVTVFGESATR